MGSEVLAQDDGHPPGAALEEHDAPSPWIRPRTLLVFDEFLASTGTYYTSSDLNAVLADCGRYQFQAVVDKATGTTADLSLRLEHSADGIHFEARNDSAELKAGPITIGGTSNLCSAVDADGSRAIHGAVRLLVLFDGTGTPQAHVKLWITLRPFA